jgi:hypothetical protein
MIKTGTDKEGCQWGRKRETKGERYLKWERGDKEKKGKGVRKLSQYLVIRNKDNGCTLKMQTV